MSDAAMETSRFEIGRVFNTTFDLVGKNFVPFFVLSLLFSGAPQAVLLIMQQNAFQSGDPGAIAVISGIGALVTLIFAYILTASLTRGALDSLSGRGASLAGALGAGLRYAFPLFLMGIVAGLAIVVGLIFLIVPGVLLALRWTVAGPTMIAEPKTGVFAALGRSAKLTERHRWAIFGIMLIFIVIAYIASVVIVVATGAMGAMMDPTQMPTFSIGYLLAAPLLQAVLAMFGTTGIAAIYFELRRAKEGVGAADVAAVFD